MNNREINYYIFNQNKYIWENKISKTDLDDWLNNFKGESIKEQDEKEIALEMLTNFIYFNENEVKSLCRIAFSTFKQEKIKNFLLDNQSIDKAESIFKDFIKNCRFYNVGKPSESGGYISYFFRQETDLPISSFQEKLNNFTDNIQCLLFIDDFLGTGDTAIDFWKSKPFKKIIKKYPNFEFYYIALIALKKGLDDVMRNTKFKIICPQIFTDEYRIFSDKSFLFQEKRRRKISKKFAYHYGKLLEGKEYALGYKDSQMLIGLHHNIPDNTLPIIWSDSNSWYPIFKREKKKYGWKK